jgi:hypothetical protein
MTDPRSSRPPPLECGPRERIVFSGDAANVVHPTGRWWTRPVEPWSSSPPRRVIYAAQAHDFLIRNSIAIDAAPRSAPLQDASLAATIESPPCSILATMMSQPEPVSKHVLQTRSLGASRD